MRARQKMKDFGMVALQIATGRSLSIVYRWHKALGEGRGINDRNKRALIAATAGSPFALVWADFEPTCEDVSERREAA